jgi:hypothetical protein
MVTAPPPTVTDAVVSAIFILLTWITAEPGAIGLTGTFTVFEFAWKVAVAGTVATAGLLELRLTVTADCAGADRIRKVCCVEVPGMVKLAGEKATVYVDCTVWLEEGRP